MAFKDLETSEKKSVKGMISLVKLEDFSNGVILPHEETLSKAKTDRFNLMSETFCNFSQIYCLYMDDGSTFTLLEEAEKAPINGKKTTLEVKDGDGVLHTLEKITDKDTIAQIEGKLADKKLYIADGHHRYETALNFRNTVNNPNSPIAQKVRELNPNADYMMMFLVDMENDGLVIYPTHRIVRGLENFDSKAFLEKCEEDFEVKRMGMFDRFDAEDEQGRKSFVYYNGRHNYRLTFKNKLEIEGKSEAYCNLDVTILHECILEKILGIDKENMAQQINLTYTKNADDATYDVDNLDDVNCCFYLNATKVSELKDVANAGEKMPQKSTYFYPKMITGLVMNYMPENN
jgi:uncharacterized protein (DUF1015 family)